MFERARGCVSVVVVVVAVVVVVVVVVVVLWMSMWMSMSMWVWLCVAMCGYLWPCVFLVQVGAHMGRRGVAAVMQSPAPTWSKWSAPTRGNAIT